MKTLRLRLLGSPACAGIDLPNTPSGCFRSASVGKTLGTAENPPPHNRMIL